MCSMIGTTPGVIKVPKGAVFIRVKQLRLVGTFYGEAGGWGVGGRGNLGVFQPLFQDLSSTGKNTGQHFNSHTLSHDIKSIEIGA